jgi:hypothetical protein
VKEGRKEGKDSSKVKLQQFDSWLEDIWFLSLLVHFVLPSFYARLIFILELEKTKYSPIHIIFCNIDGVTKLERKGKERNIGRMEWYQMKFIFILMTNTCGKKTLLLFKMKFHFLPIQCDLESNLNIQVNSIFISRIVDRKVRLKVRVILKFSIRIWRSKFFFLVFISIRKNNLHHQQSKIS